VLLDAAAAVKSEWVAKEVILRSDPVIDEASAK